MKNKIKEKVFALLFFAVLLNFFIINYFFKEGIFTLFNSRDITNGNESLILTVNLYDNSTYKELFQLDAKNVQNRTMEMTQNYFIICGKTLLNESQFCGEKILKIKPNPGEIVPNIIHYVLLNITDDIQFYHVVCMMSAFWINQPKLMIFWYDILPKGNHWNYLTANLSSVSKQIILMPILFPKTVYSHKLKFLEHYSDVIRLEVLILFGGIYLDMDVVIVNSFQPLFKYPLILGREIALSLCNGIMVSKRENNLLKRWHMFYRFYPNATGWGTLSVLLIDKLQTIFSKYVRVEEEALCRPNGGPSEVSWIFGKKRVWNWKKKNYSVHLWARTAGVKPTWKSILAEDSMFGDIFRWILFGKTDLTLPFNNTKEH